MTIHQKIMKSLTGKEEYTTAIALFNELDKVSLSSLSSCLKKLIDRKVLERKAIGPRGGWGYRII